MTDDWLKQMLDAAATRPKALTAQQLERREEVQKRNELIQAGADTFDPFKN